MDQYYSSNPTSMSNERIINYKLNNNEFQFIVDNGVFSKNRVDFATDLMLKSLISEELQGNLLDVGCGYGVIGITLSKIFNLKCKMVDINNRAVELSKKNIELNKCKNTTCTASDGFQAILEDEKFDIIITNPPIRAGKAVIYNIYEESYNHLKEGGALYLVINNKHGAPTTKKKLIELFGNCEVLDKKDGFNVIKCIK